MLWLGLGEREANEPACQQVGVEQLLQSGVGNYDVIAVPGMPNGRREDRKWPVLPDATGLIRHPLGALRCFIEVDRGRPVRSWYEKIMAYRAYAGSAALKDRYQTNNLGLVLVQKKFRLCTGVRKCQRLDL